METVEEFLDPGLEPVDVEDESAYQPPDIETDADDISQRVFDDLAVRAPGWEANDGNLEVWLTEAFADVAAEVRGLAADVPASIFQTYGEQILGIAALPPTPATALSAWTMADDSGYTIEAGWQVALARGGDEQIAFEVVQEVEVPPGTTEAAGVELVAIEPGVSGNGLSGAAEVLEPITWVDTVTVAAPTTGGSQGQTTDEYLDLLAQLMRLIALRPILPGDFAVLALRVPGVGRAVAMDTFSPAGGGTWDNERTVTVLVTDAAGEPLPGATKDQVDAYLQAQRELNFEVHVADPSYEAVDVSYELACFDGFDPEAVRGECNAALGAYLSPANWRLGVQSPSTAAGEVILPPAAGGAVGPHRTVRVYETAALLDRVRGVDYVTAVEINGAAADADLPSVTTLPRPGTIDGLVTAPDGATAP